MKKMVWIIGVLALSACATPPKKTEFSNSVTVATSKDAVWERALTYFTTNNIQIKTIEKDSGVIYAERAGAAKDLADCGTQGLLVEASRTATLNIFVRALSPKSTQVSVNTAFQAMFTDGSVMVPVACLSTGLIEAEILRAVQ